MKLHCDYMGDEAWPELKFTPAKYNTPAGAAKAFHKALTKCIAEIGMDPSIECSIHNPEQSKAHGFGRNWRVCWESGPSEWAIAASAWMNTKDWYTEPYYSFDLCFTEL